MIGAFAAFSRENAFNWWPSWLKVPSMLEFPGRLGGHPWAQWTISWEMSLIMVAAGAIIGLRVTTSMLIGGIINYGFLAPKMVQQGVITELGYRGIVAWSLWGGTALMVSSGLVNFGMQWRAVGRAFSGMLNMFSTGRGSEDPNIRRMDSIEVPGSWFLGGMIIGTAGVVTIQVISFSIAWWMGLLSVAMTFFLAVVACRSTGETDITPIGAMGKVTQLFYGIIAPSDKIVNLMTACVTAGAASSSADLLNDLKSGYLLGANPRKQFIAQFLGIFAGAAVIVPAFYLLVPSPDVLGSNLFPAPSAQVWKGVAELLAGGIRSLHISARWALLVGALVGIFIPLLERFGPRGLRPFIPSAMGLGLAFVIPFWNTLSMFTGALAATVLARTARAAAERHTIPVASGLIAGESIMGVLMALLGALGLMK
jgi:OPT family oligopeptide transporter